MVENSKLFLGLVIFLVLASIVFGSFKGITGNAIWDAQRALSCNGDNSCEMVGANIRGGDFKFLGGVVEMLSTGFRLNGNTLNIDAKSMDIFADSFTLNSYEGGIGLASSKDISIRTRNLMINQFQTSIGTNLQIRNLANGRWGYACIDPDGIITKRDEPCTN